MALKYYSKIPLIGLAWDWTCTKLLNIPDYQTIPILTSVLTGNLLSLLLYLGCTTNHNNIPLGYLIRMLIQGHLLLLLLLLLCTLASS